MKKPIKILLISIIAIAIFIGGIVILLITTVNQETIKTKIVQLVHYKTKRELIINGKMQWSFFPWLGIKLQDVTLSNAPNFKGADFAKAGEIDISVKLLPLISGRIEAGHLALKDFSLWLIESNSTINNWQDLLTTNSYNTNDRKTRPALNQPSSLANNNIFAANEIIVDSISISNGNLFWQSKQTNKKFEIKKLDLYCKNIRLNELFVIKTSFYLHSTNPLLDGDFKINTEIKLDKTYKIYSLENLQIIGKINQPFDQPFDFTGNANIELDFTNSYDFLQTMKLTGDLKANKMVIKKLNFENFSMNLSGNNGLFNLSEIKSNFYHGALNGNADIDTRGYISKFNLKLKADNVAMQNLLSDFAAFNKFSGTLTLNADITMSDKNNRAMQNSMNGTGKISIINGAYNGADIPHAVKLVHAILNKKPIPPKLEPAQTNFDHLTMSFKINNSLLNTKDILIQAPDYRVTGGGNANIASQQLDLLLNAYSTHDENLFVPISVKGSFTNPSITPKLDTIIKGQAAKQMKKVIQKQIQKINIPGKLIDVLPLDKLIH